MHSLSSKESFFIGVALSNSSNYDSSICVLDRNSNIILLDKFYYSQDIDYFFENSPYTSRSIILASAPQENKMLDGKWRIHSKNYQVLGEHFKVNRNNWTNRISKRCSDTFLKLKDRGLNVLRCDINQLRQSYGLCAHYLQRTSIDCKNLQTSLKIKFGFDLPENMLPASSLESIICAMFALDVANSHPTKKMYEIESIPVVARA